MKKKTLVPLIVFLLGMCLVGLIVYKTDAIESVQLAPNGVVTDIYPAEGNTYSYSYRIFYFYRICSVGSYLGLADIKRK